MINNQPSRVRKKKQVKLSEDTIEMVSKYAKKSGKTFSKTIEILAMSSLEAGADMGIFDLVRGAIRLGMMEIHFQFFRLFLFNAQQASIAKETSRAIFIWILQERFKDYLETLPYGEKPTHAGFQQSMRLKKGSLEAEILGAEIQERLGKYRDRGLTNFRSMSFEEVQEVLDDLVKG